MTLSGITLLCYLAFLLVGLLRMRRFGAKPADLLTFVCHLSVFFWLIFLFVFLSSEEYLSRGLRAPNDSWMPWSCLLLGVLLLPVMVRDMARGMRARGHDPTTEERDAAFQALRRQYPGAGVTLIVGAAWLIFLSGRTFGFFLSHIWLIVLSIGASVAVGWIIVRLINHRRLPHKGSVS
jgi:hypothetical protein